MAAVREQHMSPSLSQHKFSSTELGLKSRGELRALAKENGIRANQKSKMIVAKLKVLKQQLSDDRVLPVTPKAPVMAGGSREVSTPDFPFAAGGPIAHTTPDFLFAGGGHGEGGSPVWGRSVPKRHS